MICEGDRNSIFKYIYQLNFLARNMFNLCQINSSITDDQWAFSNIRLIFRNILETLARNDHVLPMLFDDESFSRDITLFHCYEMLFETLTL